MLQAYTAMHSSGESFPSQCYVVYRPQNPKRVFFLSSPSFLIDCNPVDDVVLVASHAIVTRFYFIFLPVVCSDFSSLVCFVGSITVAPPMPIWFRRPYRIILYLSLSLSLLFAVLLFHDERISLVLSLSDDTHGINTPSPRTPFFSS